jgi:outer membrane protein
MVRLNKKNMNLLKPLAIFTFAFMFHQNISAQQRVWTLRECIDFAMDNNVSIKQGDLGLEATKIVSQQAKLSYIPDGGIQSGYQLSMGHSLDPTTYSFIENTYVNSTNISVSIGTTIFNGFRKYNTVKRSLSEVKVSEFEVEVLKNNISLSITRYYYNILLNKEVMASVENQINISNASIAKMRRLVEEGAAPDEQLQNLLMQQQNEIYSLTESRGMLQASIVDLCSLLNVDNTDGFDVKQDDDIGMYLENSIESIINSAMTLPQIKAVNQKLLSAEYAIKIAKSDLYPSLSFNSSYSSSYSSAGRQVAFDGNGTPIIVDGAIAYKNYPFINQIHDNRTAIFGFNLSIPILSAFHVKKNIQLSRNNIKQLQYEVQNVEKNIKDEVRKLYIDVQTAKEKYGTSMAAVEHGTKIVSYAENKLNNGLTTITDYIIAKNNILISEAQLSRAKYEYLLKLKILKFYYTQSIY